MVWWWPAILGRTHTLPPPLGDYVPGCGDVMTGDGCEEGTFVRLYYPTRLDKNQDHSQYWPSWVPHRKYLDGFARVLNLWTFVFFFLYKLVSGDTKVPAAENVQIDQSSKKFRTIVLSHGMGGTRFLYSAICCELASHGYLVAAVEHRDESAGITWYTSSKEPGKQLWMKFKMVKIGTKQHATLRTEQVNQRAEEARRVLELLHYLNEGKVDNTLNNNFNLAMFKDRLDLSAPVMIGHSFGGATALLTLSKSPEFKCGIILDPWMFPLHNLDISQEVKQPLICINTQSFQTEPNLRDLKKYTIGAQPALRENYTIRQTTHENQSDSVHLIGYWFDFLMKKIDPVLATRLNNALIVKFLREQLDGGLPTCAEDCLHDHGNYLVHGLTVDGVNNRTKPIPANFVTFL